MPDMRLTVVLLALALALLRPAPALAHDATTTAHAEVTGTGVDVRVVLELEYDLLMKSAWLYASAYEAKERAEQLHQLDINRDAVVEYVTGRFAVAYDDRPCAPALTGAAGVLSREKKTFATLTFAFTCRGEPGGSHAISSALFPDAETFVHSTETLVRYALDGERGSAVLVTESPTLRVGEPRAAARGGVATPAVVVAPAVVVVLGGLLGWRVRRRRASRRAP